MNSTLKEEVSIVLSGEAGQGIQTIESLLTYILKREGGIMFSLQRNICLELGGVEAIQLKLG